MDSLTDEQLVLQIQNGNREAFEQLYWRYKDRIIGVAYGVLRNQQDALEVTQEVFVRLYNNIDKYQPNSHFFTWVYRIAHNLAIDRYRRKRTASEVEFDHEFQLNYTTSDIPLAPSLGIDPERSAERSELRAHHPARNRRPLLRGNRRRPRHPNRHRHEPTPLRPSQSSGSPQNLHRLPRRQKVMPFLGAALWPLRAIRAAATALSDDTRGAPGYFVPQYARRLILTRIF